VRKFNFPIRVLYIEGSGRDVQFSSRSLQLRGKGVATEVELVRPLL